MPFIREILLILSIVVKMNERITYDIYKNISERFQYIGNTFLKDPNVNMTTLFNFGNPVSDYIHKL